MRKPILFIIVATTSLTQWAACGRAPYAARQTANNNFTWTQPTTGTSSGGSSGSGTSPVIEQRVDLIGYGSGFIDVSTNSTLRIRVAPGINDRTIAGTGFSPQFSRMYVRVRAFKLGFIGTIPENTTPVMHNGLTAAAQQSPIYNLDNAWGGTPTCTQANPTCRESIRIVIDQPNTDYFWTNNIYSYQPQLNGPWAPTPEFTHVQNGHPSHVTVTIQTVDTVGLQ